MMVLAISFVLETSLLGIEGNSWRLKEEAMRSCLESILQSSLEHMMLVIISSGEVLGLRWRITSMEESDIPLPTK